MVEKFERNTLYYTYPVRAQGKINNNSDGKQNENLISLLNIQPRTKYYGAIHYIIIVLNCSYIIVRYIIVTSNVNIRFVICVRTIVPQCLFCVLE